MVVGRHSITCWCSVTIHGLVTNILHVCLHVCICICSLHHLFFTPTDFCFFSTICPWTVSNIFLTAWRQRTRHILLKTKCRYIKNTFIVYFSQGCENVHAYLQSVIDWQPWAQEMFAKMNSCVCQSFFTWETLNDIFINFIIPQLIGQTS
jgi:hypothetical protein